MKIVRWRDNKDGSATVTLELNKKDESQLKTVAEIQHKKYSKKFIREIILEGIKHGVKTDAYKIWRKELNLKDGSICKRQ